MKPGPHELAQQHPKKGVNNESRNAPNDALPPRSGRQNNKSVGTDFRYAVEFSKNGRTPSPVSRPAWGQPWKHYPVRFAVSNCPARSALLAATGAQLTDPCGCGHRGCRPRPVDRSGAMSSRSGRCRFPLGHGRSYGLDCRPRQTCRSAAFRVILPLNRCRSEVVAVGGRRRPTDRQVITFRPIGRRADITALCRQPSATPGRRHGRSRADRPHGPTARNGRRPVLRREPSVSHPGDGPLPARAAPGTCRAAGRWPSGT